jgi:hypothetical protein
MITLSMPTLPLRVGNDFFETFLSFNFIVHNLT